MLDPAYVREHTDEVLERLGRLDDDPRRRARREERNRCALVCDHIVLTMRPEGVSAESVEVFKAGVNLVKQFILDGDFTPAVLPPPSEEIS